MDYEEISRQAYEGQQPKSRDALVLLYWEYMRVLYAAHKHGLLYGDKMEAMAKNVEKLIDVENVMRKAALKTNGIMNALLAAEAVDIDEYSRILREDRGR